MARALTYTYAAFGVPCSGASAGSTPRATVATTPSRAFVAEVAPMIEAGLSLASRQRRHRGRPRCVEPAGRRTRPRRITRSQSASCSRSGGVETMGSPMSRSRSSRRLPAPNAIVAMFEAKGARATGLPTADVLAGGHSVVVVGSKPGVLDHENVGSLGDAVVVGAAPLVITARGLATAQRAGARVLADFVSASGPVLRSVDGFGDDESHRPRHRRGRQARGRAPRKATSSEPATSAEEFLRSWVTEMPFGRPARLSRTLCGWADRRSSPSRRSPPRRRSALHRKQRLAAGFRLFGRFGFDEGVAGHITARDPERPDHFWVNPFGMSFRQIRVSDLILVNHDGEVVEGDRPVNRGRVRHPLARCTRRGPTSSPPRTRIRATARRSRRSAARSIRSRRTPARSTTTTPLRRLHRRRARRSPRASASPHALGEQQGGHPEQPRPPHRRRIGRRGRVVVHHDGAHVPGAAARRGGRHAACPSTRQVAKKTHDRSASKLAGWFQFQPAVVVDHRPGARPARLSGALRRRSLRRTRGLPPPTTSDQPA